MRETIGIMVLSPTCHVLYVNRAAQEFLRELRGQERNRDGNSALPAPILELFQEMVVSLQTSMTSSCHKPLQAQRRATGELPLLLQAFGIQDRLGNNRFRVVITMHGMHSLETRSREASLFA